MRITVYDGATTIGGNKIYLEEEGKGIFLDFGMNFARHRLYYDEFLRERSSRGIYDAIQLGMIPRLNVYRKEGLRGSGGSKFRFSKKFRFAVAFSKLLGYHIIIIILIIIRLLC
jgi:hypothetical protein